ncbi:CYTH and CHAD domain-containing protein [Roseiarcus sp.]|uniref:CYTH and CHAD domain-containing protein n=1 Tax=Roseiarcus sp. TaxID=1969460 RepID=UPI003F988F77
MTRETHSQCGGEGGAEAGAERELKFVADRKTLRAALASPPLGGEAGPPAWRKLKTVYFDTDEGDLSRARVALRVRRSRDGWVMGLKRAAAEDRGAFEREETEVASPSGDLDLSLFDKATAREITDITGDKSLAPRFGSDIRRAARTIETNGAAIEVAFDEGFLFAGERRAPTAEIELELKSGPPAALFDLGLALVEAFPVRLGLQSKAERAHALMSAEPPEPAYAEDPTLRPDTPLDKTIAAVMRNCLAHFLGNLSALEAGDAVEAVHQMRVAMRRLRSALGLFGRAFPCAEFEALRAESARIAAVLGEARDWDVFVERLSDGALKRFAQDPGFDVVLAAAEAKGAAGHAAVKQAAGGKAVARFALGLERLAAARGWRNGASEETLAALDQPVDVFAAQWLEALDRRVRRRGRHFRSLTPEARHALRIAMKHMRYATEFFGGLFHPKSAAKRYIEKAAALQDLLGDLNDAAIALRLVKALGPAKHGQAAYAAGVIAGWCARESEGDLVALRKAWRDFATTAPYWRREDKNGRRESA